MARPRVFKSILIVHVAWLVCWWRLGAAAECERPGGLVLAAPLELPAPTQPGAVKSGDLDGDGVPDLAVLASSRLAVFHGRGEGEFSSPEITRVDGGSSLLLEDLDRDGRTDAAVLFVLRDGTAGIAFLYQTADGMLARGGGVSVSAFARSLRASDLEGDGDLDLVVASSQAPAVSIVENRRSRAFRLHQILPVPQEPLAAVAGDVDGDGIADLVIPAVEALFIARGGPDGRFSTLDRSALRIRTPALADFDRDGDLDLVASLGRELELPARVALLANDGEGRFALFATHPVDENPRQLAIGDLDGDGALDVAVVEKESELAVVVLGEAGGGFAEAFALEGDDPSGLTIADTDGDGATDLAVTNQGNDVVTLWRNVPLAGEPDCNQNGIPDDCEAVLGTSDDCDGNGRPDSCDLMSDAGLERRRSLPARTGPRFVEAGDLDADGDADLVAPLAGFVGPDRVAVFRNRGNGWFLEPELLEVGERPEVVRAADLDADGDLDLAVLLSRRRAPRPGGGRPRRRR